jgi:hypothetical protein
LERHSLNVKKCLSDVLFTGESNFDERNVQLIQGSFLKKELLKKIHTLRRTLIPNLTGTNLPIQLSKPDWH